MTRCIYLLLAALLLALALPAPSGSAQKQDVLVVIIGRSVALKDISLSALRSAFRGEATTVANGIRLLPFNHAPGTPERGKFDLAVLGVAPADIGRFWIARRIRDEGLPPRTVPSAQLAMRIVATVTGAITYLRASVADASVQVLKIDGKGPSDAGYLLAGP